MTDGIEGIKQKYREIDEKNGKEEQLIEQICKKIANGKTPEEIAEDLEKEVDRIRGIFEITKGFAPDYDTKKYLRLCM